MKTSNLVIEKMRNFGDKPIEEKNETGDLRSWFVDVNSGFIEKLQFANQDEETSGILEILKFPLIGLLSALILGILSYFIFIKTRRMEHPTNLLLVNGKWIYLKRKDDDSSTAEPVKAEDGSRFIGFLKALGSWFQSVYYRFIEKMKTWLGKKSPEENDAKKNDTNMKDLTEDDKKKGALEETAVKKVPTRGNDEKKGAFEIAVKKETVEKDPTRGNDEKKEALDKTAKKKVTFEK